MKPARAGFPAVPMDLRVSRSIYVCNKEAFFRERVDVAFGQELRVSVFNRHDANAEILREVAFGRELFFGKDVSAYDIFFDALVKVMVEAVCSRFGHVVSEHETDLINIVNLIFN